MAFVQLIEFSTSKPEEVEKIVAEWESSSQGTRTARRVLSTKDLDDPNRYTHIVFFDSYESAMENSNLPETQEYAKKLMALMDGEPVFRNLDVLEEHDL
ncbi:hypothetical protein LQU92_04755 [Kocuria sp. LUK]|uniref:hypothetical protein n=1 Tax=Kocuria sp. LUK TaxID=2897828 RepID=UPI001E3B6799|nr:hypothetical protein [Kocuria sp. LUK]MCD1144553.1 hypothetical protein [Kocuria sp. LUK]